MWLLFNKIPNHNNILKLIKICIFNYMIQKQFFGNSFDTINCCWAQFLRNDYLIFLHFYAFLIVFNINKNKKPFDLSEDIIWKANSLKSHLDWRVTYHVVRDRPMSSDCSNMKAWISDDTMLRSKLSVFNLNEVCVYFDSGRSGSSHDELEIISRLVLPEYVNIFDTCRIFSPERW